MGVRLKRVGSQVIVITGASSGIGLATAKLAAKRGAKVVLASRNGVALSRVVEEIKSQGGQACYVEADVSEKDAMDRVAAIAEKNYGGFDTWVNNAGISIFGRLTEVDMAEKRRLFDVNFWGVVNGCRSAVKHLKKKGGAIINVGSVVSDFTVPLQGIYSASKHAVKAYTEALRMELEKDGLPISVSLVKPSSINTPFIEHAANHLDVKPKLPAPVYEPETVARAILACAEKPIRDIVVGGGGRAFSILNKLLPRLLDKYQEATMFRQQRTSQAASDSEGILFFVNDTREGKTRGPQPGHVSKSSLYTTARLHPAAAVFIGTLIGVLVSSMSNARGRSATRTRKQSTRIKEEAPVTRDWLRAA